MLDILKFYVSDFWVWAGITYGLIGVLYCLRLVIGAFSGRR